MSLKELQIALSMTPADLKAARHQLGLTARELGELLGVTWNTVLRWEGGSRKPPTSTVVYIRQLVAEKQVPA